MICSSATVPLSRGQQVPHCPDRIGNARAIQGVHSDRTVHPDKVVPLNPQADAGFVIRQLAAVGVRPANVTAKMGANAKVEAFDMTGADKTRLGMSAPDTWDSPRNPTRGTKPIGAGHDVGARIQLDKLREMNVNVEMGINGVNVMAQSIRRQLVHALRALAQATDGTPMRFRHRGFRRDAR
jgi:hypothetical protein